MNIEKKNEVDLWLSSLNLNKYVKKFEEEKYNNMNRIKSFNESDINKMNEPLVAKRVQLERFDMN
eukprot:TRINITY_DN2487_c0_g1_i1.p2 TRINITY_DN2487_c0_g1~~TRINITY_DN2487_c0_g1_i1.p2  ORF type:complete len:65 (-),score=8.42 TRINITY_DN2487_c0_g1_i1:561-755(-)